MIFPVEGVTKIMYEELKKDIGEEHKNSVPCMERSCDNFVPSKLIESDPNPSNLLQFVRQPFCAWWLVAGGRSYPKQSIENLPPTETDDDGMGSKSQASPC